MSQTGSDNAPAGGNRRVTDRREQDRYTAQLAEETQRLNDRLGSLTDALTGVSRVQERQIALEHEIRAGREETRDLNEVVTLGHVRRQHRTYALIVLASLITTLVVLAIGAVAYRAIRPAPPYDPFNFPMQTVSDRYNGATIPTVHLGADVHVHAVKCSSAKHAVQEQGSTVWSTTEPAGTSVPVSTASSGSVAPGCTQHDYDNAMPASVVARTKALYAAGAKTVVWSITGVERPLQPGGVGEGWQTEPFAVVP